MREETENLLENYLYSWIAYELQVGTLLERRHN